MVVTLELLAFTPKALLVPLETLPVISRLPASVVLTLTETRLIPLELIPVEQLVPLIASVPLTVLTEEDPVMQAP